MFIIKYHKPKYKTKYFSKSKGLVSTKKSATAFGESFREKAVNKFSNNSNMFIVTINVTELAEFMYKDKIVKVRDIQW